MSKQNFDTFSECVNKNVTVKLTDHNQVYS